MKEWMPAIILSIPLITPLFIYILIYIKENEIIKYTIFQVILALWAAILIFIGVGGLLFNFLYLLFSGDGQM